MILFVIMHGEWQLLGQVGRALTGRDRSDSWAKMRRMHCLPYRRGSGQRDEPPLQAPDGRKRLPYRLQA